MKTIQLSFIRFQAIFLKIHFKIQKIQLNDPSLTWVRFGADLMIYLESLVSSLNTFQSSNFKNKRDLKE